MIGLASSRLMAEVLACARRCRIVDPDHLAVGGDQRTTRVSGIDRGVVLEHRIHRRPIALTIGRRLGDDAPGERELGVS